MRRRALARLLLAPLEVFTQRRGQPRLARGALTGLAAVPNFIAIGHAKITSTPVAAPQRLT